MKAIVTEYKGPTDTGGSRILARAKGVRTISVSYDHGLDADGNRVAAAVALARKYNWTGTLHSGGMPDGRSRVHVWADGKGTRVSK